MFTVGLFAIVNVFYDGEKNLLIKCEGRIARDEGRMVRDEV